MYPLNPVTKTELKVIYENLGINEERHQRILEVFKDWIKCQPHLPNDLECRYYSNFLSLCKDDLEKAQSKFEASIIARKNTPLFNYDLMLPIDVIEETGLSRSFVPSKKLTAEGYRIIYISLQKDPKCYDTSNHIKYASMIVDTLLMGEQFSGIIAIADFISFTSEILRKHDISAIMTLVNYYMQAVPQRLMYFHMINAASFVKPIMTVAYSVMPEKLKKKFLFHDKPENLLDYLPKDFISVEYGGSVNIENEADEWINFWKENNEWKSNLTKIKLRGEIPKGNLYLNQNSGFGTAGTFRNIQVD